MTIGWRIANEGTRRSTANAMAIIDANNSHPARRSRAKTVRPFITRTVAVSIRNSTSGS
jgi:hypothetical protein